MSDLRRHPGPSQAGQSSSRPNHGAYAAPPVIPRKDLSQAQYGQSYPVADPSNTYDSSFRNRPFHHPAEAAPPRPPPHANAPPPPTDNANWGQGLHYSQSTRTNSTVTPGMDNLGPAAAGGGISGIALGVANTHERQSGLDAIQSMDVSRDVTFLPRAQPGYHTAGGAGHTYAPPPAAAPPPPPPPPPTVPEFRHAGPLGPSRDSYASDMMITDTGGHAGHLTPGQSTPRLVASNTSERDLLDPYHSAYPSSGGPSQRGPYQRDSVYSYSGDPFDINPDEIIDDGDDEFEHRPQRTSAHGVPAAAAASGAAPGILGTLGGMVRGSRTFETGGGPSYGPVPGPGLEAGEKRSVLRRSGNGNGRRRKGGWIVGLILAVVIIGAIVGGAVGGVFSHRANGGNNTASGDTAANGDLGLNSPEIQALLNDPNLHKVFPGMDYTPWGTQYPLCLKYPPSQNNVTRDLAVLSQLTNNVRLYGTDCNQTEMVLHAIDRLQLKDMKVWLGVWIDDTNTTTNERQLDQMYKVIDETSDKSIFNGAIIGNEVLFRAGADIATAETNLIAYLTSVRANFTQRGLQHLSVATSDLGDNWNAQLVQAADVVMSNVHPFFAGVNVDTAASWTWTFWQQHDVALTQGTNKKQIIAEVGWPSGGGNDCGTSNVCPDATAGSVAGIDQMNQFLSEWVCQALDNGTDYFWFEAFDEPWKVIYNTPGKSWEDKWGLMDAGRNLKPGLTIPDCGGKTAA